MSDIIVYSNYKKKKIIKFSTLSKVRKIIVGIKLLSEKTKKICVAGVASRRLFIIVQRGCDSRCEISANVLLRLIGRAPN